MITENAEARFPCYHYRQEKSAMAEAPRSGEVPKAADRREVLRERLAEGGRAGIAEDVRRSRLEHERGEAREVTLDELMDEITG